MYGYASSTMANCGLPLSAMPSRTPIARIMSAKYGGILKGKLKVISARSAASSCGIGGGRVWWCGESDERDVGS